VVLQGFAEEAELGELLTPPRHEPLERDPPLDSREALPAAEIGGREPSRSASPRGGARVGVMPLQLIGTSPTEVQLSVGLADDITSGLARFRWMWLATSGSVARLAAHGRDEEAVRAAFGLDFLVDGTVQRGGDRVRVSLRLLDLRDGHHEVWSQRFEGSAQDLLTFQDEVAAAAAAQIEPEILQVEAQRAADTPSRDPSAYDLLLRGLSLIPCLEKPRFLQAGGLLNEAMVLQPDCASIHAWCAYWRVLLLAQDWAEDRTAAVAEASHLAERAIALDPQDARALTIAGHVRAALQRRPREGIALHDRALSLNPNLTMAWSLSAMAFAYLGELDEAARRVAVGKTLSPSDRQGFFFDTAPMVVALLRHDHQAAVDFGRDASSLNGAFRAAVKPYLAALGHLRMEADAAAIRARLLAQEPEFRVEPYLDSIPMLRAADREHIGAGLKLAGIQA
jgi:TolB-like protein